MNVFIPYDDLKRSASCLDDIRLNKQILECYQILQVGLNNSKGYKNHPIVKHWISSLESLCKYAFYCCLEYEKRKGYKHKYQVDFYHLLLNPLIKDQKDLTYFYAEGSINDPECIRTYNKEEVISLYRQKLINKWKSDIDKERPPKWTNSEPPDFWINNLDYEDRLKYWNINS